jgi:hypothetical protein
MKPSLTLLTALLLAMMNVCHRISPDRGRRHQRGILNQLFYRQPFFSMSTDQQPPIEIHANRNALGAAAARRFQTWVEAALRTKPKCRVVFGCAPSQDDFFRALVLLAQAMPELWRRVEVFHMDDYVGLPENHPQTFRSYLHRHFLDYVKTAGFHPIRGEADSPNPEAARYAALLAEAPIDVIGMGIGEDGVVRQPGDKCAFAGSSLTMDVAVLNVQAMLGWTRDQAFAACSTRVAEYLGWPRKARLAAKS